MIGQGALVVISIVIEILFFSLSMLAATIHAGFCNSVNALQAVPASIQSRDCRRKLNKPILWALSLNIEEPSLDRETKMPMSCHKRMVQDSCQN